MTQTEFLDEITAKLHDLMVRLPAAIEGLTDEEFNAVAPGGDWSLAGIIDHMLIAAGPYVQTVRPLLTSPKPTRGHLKNTFLGGMVAKASGPQGRVPAPKKMYPRKRHYNKGIVEDWLATHEEILHMAEAAKEVDLSQRFNNPFVPFMRCNLVDFFTIMVNHAERHVGQIEERRSGVVAA